VSTLDLFESGSAEKRQAAVDRLRLAIVHDGLMQEDDLTDALLNWLVKRPCW